MTLGVLPVRYWLSLVLCTCLIPVWAGTVWIVDHATLTKRQAIEAGLLHAAEALSLGLDGHIASLRLSLEALATSPSLDARDFHDFHRQSRAVAALFPKADIILTDESGRQVVNTYVDYGKPLPKRSLPAVVQKVFLTGKVQLRPHFRGKLTGRSLVGIDVPVIRRGNVLYDLGLTFPCQDLTDILIRSKQPTSWIASIVDDTGIVIGHNVNGQALVGRRIELPLTNGTYVGTVRTVEGIPAIMAIAKSEATGWQVAVAMPKAVFDSEVWSWRRWMISWILGLTLLGAVVAWLIGRFISRGIESLVEPATRLGKGERVDIRPTRIVETAHVATALATASAVLEKHRQDLVEGIERERRMARQAEELSLHAAHLDKASRTDPLLGIANRRHFDELIEVEWRRARRARNSLAIVMLDVDHFKRFNDANGHVAGDVCLRTISDRVVASVQRPADTVARFGGEELVILLPQTDMDGAYAVAERVRQAVAETPIFDPSGTRFGHITISAGVAAVTPGGAVRPTDLIAAADAALYQSKSAGRNRVTRASGFQPSRD